MLNLAALAGWLPNYWFYVLYQYFKKNTCTVLQAKRAHFSKFDFSC